MRHAGMHWPENAGGEHPNRETIAALPGVKDGCALICSPSARYHYGYLRQRSPLVIWRAIPRVGKRPAELGWNADRVAAECMNLWFEQPAGGPPQHGGTEWFLPLNEPQRDDVELGGAFPGYGEWARFCSRLREALRAIFRGQDVKLMFPAFVPLDEGDHVEDWAWEAKLWDAVAVHCYGSAEAMRQRYDAYRALFPGQPLFVGEWNANHEGHDERAALEMWADVAASDALFLGATYYIWETNNAGERDLSVYGNAAREELFRNPPVAQQPAPAPEPTPSPEPIPMPPPYRLPAWTPAYVDIRDGAIQVAEEYRMPRRRLLGLCLAECGFGLQSFDRWASVERTRRMKAAIDAQDWPAVEAIFAEIPPTGSNDLSFGSCHPAYWWSFTAAEQQAHPEWRYDLARIMEFRAKLIEDHGYALRKAADMLVSLEARYGAHDDQTILERYNKPNAPVSAGVRANYERSLIEADRILAELFPAPVPAPEPAPFPGAVLFEDYRDPQPAGTYGGTPRGVILHGSRSGKAGNPKAAEYAGTASWEVNNPNDLGWSATIGEGRVAVHLTPREWGWNARGSSSHWLAVEFAQATVDEPITDAQVEAFCVWLRDYILPIWPGLPFVFPTHADLDGTPEYGPRDGKSDVFPRGDARADELRARIMARLEPSPVPQPQPEPPPAPAPAPQPSYTVGSGILAAMVAHGDEPATDEIYQGASAWSEAYGRSGSRYVWLPSLGKVVRFDPAA